MGEKSVDRRAAWLLFVATLFVYAYFFQGPGWNQNAHFDTVRALVEHGSAEITAYADNTGDVSRIGGRVFSNKPPGLPLLGVPIYWLAMHIERACGIDISAPPIVLANMHLTTVWVCAVPGALVIVVLYRLFRHERVSPRDALLLSAALAFGSLIWPYAGVMMSHLAVTAGLVSAWWLISGKRSPARIFFAGLCSAIAAACDYFAAPIVALFFFYLLWRGGRLRTAMLFCGGPILVALAVVAFNYCAFGHLFATTYSFEDPHFKHPGLLFGQFHWPQWQRLYWITYQRMRGLFVCCPMFIVPIISLRALRRSSLRAERIVPLLVVGHFVLFMLTFLGWTGGWGIGPRYLVPVLPFLWLYATHAIQRYRTICLLVIALSIATMLAVTSVQVMYPANEFGPPQHWDPVGSAWLGFLRGQLAKSPDSYNLGMKLGLPGIWSVVPVIAAIAAFFVIAWRYFAASAERASGNINCTQRAYSAADGCNPSSAASEAN